MKETLLGCEEKEEERRRSETVITALTYTPIPDNPIPEKPPTNEPASDKPGSEKGDSEKPDAPEVLIRNQSMEEVVQKIHEGSTLWKVRGVNKWFQRHYKVDVDNMCLVGESKKWWSPGGGIGKTNRLINAVSGLGTSLTENMTV